MNDSKQPGDEWPSGSQHCSPGAQQPETQHACPVGQHAGPPDSEPSHGDWPEGHGTHRPVCAFAQ
jgi:hypothetical protein